MTNSTDNNSPKDTILPEVPATSMDKNKKEKKLKKKGPLRFEAIGSVLIVCGCTYGYTHFFLDAQMKSLAQWSATKVHGAEVNIGSIKTSFFKGSFLLQNLEVTKKEDPNLNMLQIGEIRFQALWDALLRAKIVIEEASIENIQLNSPRKKPGRILPKKETAIEKVKSSQTAKSFEKNVLKEGKEEFSGSALGDVTEVLGGKDPSEQINDVKTEFKAEEQITSLIKELEEKEKAWTNKINELSDQKELDALIEKVTNFKFNEKDPLKSAKELDKIVKESKSKVSEFTKTTKELSSDVSKYSSMISNVDNLIEADIQSLMKRLKIPQVDMADMSKDIFAGMFLDQLGEYKKYADMAMKYIPADDENTKTPKKESTDIKARERGVGKTYHFPKKKGYPFFWLKKSIISSKANASEYSGNIKGVISNFTNEPRILGVPAKISFQGDFPSQNVAGVDGLITIDRTGDSAHDTVKFNVASFPVEKKVFSDSDSLKLSLTKAQGSSDLSMSFRPEKINIDLKNKFNEAEYSVKASAKEAQDVISNVVNGIKLITLNANASGKSWGDLSWGINSNFGKEIAQGIKRSVEEKIAAAKRKVEEHVKSKINSKKKELENKYSSVKNKIDTLIAKNKAQFEKVTNQISNQVDSKKKAPANKAKKAGKKALDKLKKKLKF